MEIYERINELINTRGLSKRDFAQRLIALEPKLKTTGETPTEKTIYKYLNGTISIRIELIPYIAQALNILEQEIFITSTKERVNFYRTIIQRANDKELEIMKKRLLDKLEIDNILNTKNKAKLSTKSDSKTKIIELLDYAPLPLVESLLITLKSFEELTKNMVKN